MINDNIEYLPRISDRLLDRKLHTSGAVLITGCKWCGKTMSAEQFANSVIYMQDPDKSSSYLAMADTKPSLLLNGASPRLIDEWQMAPVLWDAVRHEVDKRRTQGQFILTGSAVPLDDATAHTGSLHPQALLQKFLRYMHPSPQNTYSLRQPQHWFP